jgi:SAM-dependent methyltransferase
MVPASTPYDELAYKSSPIEWTAPERLALTSLVHGGPRPRLDSYRVLELGCGNGSNLLPLAYYRRVSTFVGIDGALSHFKVAEERKAALGLSNIEFIHADFRSAGQNLSGQFDYVVAHGVFSWVPRDARDALLELCVERLRQGGLLYLNYNTRPGWNVRGLVREFLLAQTAAESSLRRRAELAKKAASKVVSALTGVDHHYSRLLANEFRFVSEGDVSWVGHEFLAEVNNPYWRSEFLALVRAYGLEYVADADFNYSSGRIPEEFAPRLELEGITGRSIDDTVDLLCYRQLHSPILAHGPLDRVRPDLTEFGNIHIASCLEPMLPVGAGEKPRFKHPSGYEVEAKEEFMNEALTQLQPLWPRGLPVKALFPDVQPVYEDLLLLERNGLIELRLIEPGDFGIDGDALNRLELEWGGYLTTPYHQTCVPSD